MTPTTISSADARCPDCGNGDAIVRVKGNAISSVCTGCRRVDVAPLLDDFDLYAIEGETMTADLFELEAARSGAASVLVSTTPKPPSHFLADAFDRVAEQMQVQVELRMPVPPR